MKRLASFVLILLVVTASATFARPKAQPKRVLAAGQNGVSNPVVVTQVNPAYTPEAVKAKTQGKVKVNLVVRKNGSVGAVRVVKHLTPALDRQAVKAVKQWKFKPAMKNGKPVAAVISLDLTFTLK